MSAQEEIIKYISRVSKGYVRLKNEHANHIVNLVLQKPEIVEVQKYVYNNSGRYELKYTVFMELELAEIKIHKLKVLKQWEGFYLYKIPQLGFEFYSVNNNLFP